MVFGFTRSSFVHTCRLSLMIEVFFTELLGHNPQIKGTNSSCIAPTNMTFHRQRSIVTHPPTGFVHLPWPINLTKHLGVIGSDGSEDRRLEISWKFIRMFEKITNWTHQIVLGLSFVLELSFVQGLNIIEKLFRIAWTLTTCSGHPKLFFQTGITYECVLATPGILVEKH